MSVTRIVICCCLVLSVSSSYVSGQQAINASDTRSYIDAERGLSMAQLVSIALERSPVVLAARARTEAARGERLQSSLRPNPSVMTDVREQLGGTDRQTMIGLNLPLDLFRRPARVAGAGERVELAERGAADVERMLAADVRTSALRLMAAVRQLEVRVQVAATLTQFLELVRARSASGAAPPLERDMAAVDARRADAEVLRQRAAADAAQVELKAVVGLPRSEPLLLRQRLEDLAGPNTFGADAATSSIDQLVSSRPDILAAERQVRSASATLDLIKSEARPDVSVSASYMRMASGFPLFGLNAAGAPAPIHDVFHNVSIGATITLPWRDRRQGDIAAGAARIQAARFETDARRLTASAEIESARARVRQLEAALAIYADTTRDLANKNVEVLRQSYELGRATLLDVLTEMRRFLETESAYTDVLIETLQARNDLATATGVIR
jgi:outer membrane protein, heavy metal efflux system